MRIGLAFRVFFKILFDPELAVAAERILEPPQGTGPARPIPSRMAHLRDTVFDVPEKRSEAITLLATLQREARFVDMVKEPLDEFSDAQVGAAARDVLRDCGKTLDRLFGLCPIVDQPEGSAVDVPRDYDAGCYRLTGNVAGEPPFQGQLVHHGWRAGKCELPTWSGNEASRLVVAPQEVEIR